MKENNKEKKGKDNFLPMTPEQKVLFFEEEFGPKERLLHQKRGNNFDQSLLTYKDVAIWKAYKKVTPGEDDGVAFMLGELADYATELDKKSEELRATKADATVNANSQLFRHFLAQIYIIDSVGPVKKRVVEQKVA